MQFAYARIRMSLRFITIFRAGSDELRGVNSVNYLVLTR